MHLDFQLEEWHEDFQATWLHIASKRDRASEGELIYRMVSGMAKHDGSKAMVVPSEKLGRFLGGDSSHLSTFEIDEDGRFLYWPHSDTHLGWKQLQQLIDPSSAIEDAKKGPIQRKVWQRNSSS